MTERFLMIQAHEEFITPASKLGVTARLWASQFKGGVNPHGGRESQFVTPPTSGYGVRVVTVHSIL